MGFGLMFVGYFITYIMALNILGVIFRLFGYMIMCKASFKLAKYNTRFKLVGAASGTLTFISLFSCVRGVLKYLCDNLILQSNPLSFVSENAIMAIDTAFVLVFHVFLMYAIMGIAKDTELPQISLSAGRNLFFIVFYFVLGLFRYLPTSIQESYNKNMGLPLALFYIVWIVLDLVLLFKCTTSICDENDIEMNRKPSRFAFVNKFVDAFEKKQQKARKEMAEYKRDRKNRKRLK